MRWKPQGCVTAILILMITPFWVVFVRLNIHSGNRAVPGHLKMFLIERLRKPNEPSDGFFAVRKRMATIAFFPVHNGRATMTM
jgi:hypothetical protein